jgi:hypothetical protein
MEQQGQFPSFLGIGAQKGGTTTLQRLLEQHPQAYLPAAKELHFFSLHYARGETWYAEQFAAAAPGQRCGEITPYYLFHPETPRRIARLLPAVKLVVLLRDPVERTLSQVFHSRRLGLEPLELEAALAAEAERLQGAEQRLVAADGRDRSHQEHSYLARSRYEQQLARYEQHFAADQLLILRSEDLFSRPEDGWLKLQTFLGLEPQPLPALPRANAGAAEAAAVPLALRRQLRAALEPTYRVLEARYGLVWP